VIYIWYADHYNNRWFSQAPCPTTLPATAAKDITLDWIVIVDAGVAGRDRTNLKLLDSARYAGK
jgi:hypothetical protein